MTYLRIENLSRKIGRELILDGIDLTLDQHITLCLLGPSGSGKTTLLRMLSGLDPMDGGQIYLKNCSLKGVPIHQRKIGFMFQDLALFPHKTVFENIAFGLRMQRLGPTDLNQRVAEMLTLVGLCGFDQRSIESLSGGERQRVALARSLAPRPQLLLLDEPLGALDRRLRQQLMGDLRGILVQVGVTTIMVTHDQAEAFRIADQVAVLFRGRIVQVGSPRRIFQAPVNSEVAAFLGLPNCIPGVAVDDRQVQTDLGMIRLPQTREELKKGPGTLILYPDSAVVSKTSPPFEVSSGMVLRVKLETISFQGTSLRIGVKWNSSQHLQFDIPRDNMDLLPGRELTLEIDTRRMVFISDSS